MKRIYTILAVLLLTTSVFAQTPQKMSYQAVVRDDNSQLITNTEVRIEINIYQGSTTGTLVYTETQTQTTNINGLLTIAIGGQTGFDTIAWENGPYFLETKIDPSNSGTYTIIGTSQLLTVPYALHAKTATSITGSINETDPVFNSWDKSAGISITESQITDLQHFTNTNETDPVFNTWDKSTGISITENQISDLQHFTNTDETDPIYLAWNKSYDDLINKPSITDTITAVLNTTTQFVRTETDPVFSSWDKSAGISITESQISDLQNYLTTEVDGSITNEIQGLSDVLIIDNNANQNRIINLSQQGIGTANPSSCAILEMKSNTQGLLPPRMSNIDIHSILNPLEGLSLYSTDEHKPYYFNGSQWVSYDTNTPLPAPPTLAIGDFYAGGVIFYLDATGHHGLVCAVSDQGTGVTWGCYGTGIDGADGTGVGDGKQNTIDILLGCNDTGTAADICNNLVLNGYNDWFLPSQGELTEMKNNRNTIKTTAIANGGSDFVNNTGYWSSSEHDINTAINLDFNSSFGWGNKSNHYHVRAIRAF